jgi:hypothetical protein
MFPLAFPERGRILQPSQAPVGKPAAAAPTLSHVAVLVSRPCLEKSPQVQASKSAAAF